MEQKKEGKVWLVGAGPSDAELLTLKAKRVLEQAKSSCMTGWWERVSC